MSTVQPTLIPLVDERPPLPAAKRWTVRGALGVACACLAGAPLDAQLAVPGLLVLCAAILLWSRFEHGRGPLLAPAPRR